MRLLHISLDLFLDPISRWAGSGTSRLPDEAYHPWALEVLHAFLEERCLLRADTPLPGAVFDPHDGAFPVWRSWMAEAAAAPFDLVLLDAHSGLGRNDEGWFYILGRLLHLPPEKRQVADLRKITPDNYVLFAIALGWIASVTLVTHPEWEDDVHPLLYGEGEKPSLVLRRYDPNILERAIEGGAEFPDPLGVEATLPFTVTGTRAFTAVAPFDRITVSRSPQFTPRASDALLPLLERHVAGR